MSSLATVCIHLHVWTNRSTWKCHMYRYKQVECIRLSIIKQELLNIFRGLDVYEYKYISILSLCDNLKIISHFETYVNIYS